MTAETWLVDQLEAWPKRVDPECTTNIEFLMKEAAKVIRRQKDALERLEQFGRPNITYIAREGLGRVAVHVDRTFPAFVVPRVNKVPVSVCPDCREWPIQTSLDGKNLCLRCAEKWSVGVEQ